MCPFVAVREIAAVAADPDGLPAAPGIDADTSADGAHRRGRCDRERAGSLGVRPRVATGLIGTRRPVHAHCDGGLADRQAQPPAPERARGVERPLEDDLGARAGVDADIGRRGRGDPDRRPSAAPAGFYGGLGLRSARCAPWSRWCLWCWLRRPPRPRSGRAPPALPAPRPPRGASPPSMAAARADAGRGRRRPPAPAA